MTSDVEIDADKTVLDLTETPCGICGSSTNDEYMVGCDGCSSWFHCRCVGITEEELPKKWYCQNKACQGKAQEYQKQQKDSRKQSRSRKQTDESDKSSVNSRKGSSSVEARVKALEERQKRQLEELETEMQLRKREKEMQRAFERKKLEMEMQMRAEEEEEQRTLQKEILREKNKQIERMMANQKSFEKQMTDLDQKLAELSVVKVPKTVPKTSDNGMEAGPTGKRNKKPLKLTKKKLKKLSERNEDTEDDDNEEDDNRSDGSRHSSKFSEPSLKSIPQSAKDVDERSQNGLGQKQVGPTKAQLAARKGLTFNLPKFSGKPAQWPLFFAAYKTSNETCGYMDHENLMRLQDSLEGDALELVSGQLILPESIPRVIEKLRRHYGRPEQLLQHLLDKVDQLEPPKPDNFGSFVPFGNTVEQLCGHLEAAELRQHLVNPLLIKSLVAKLPDREKREWVRYKRGKEEPTLRTLTDFLMEIVDDACEANVDVEFKSVYPPTSEPPMGKKKPMEKAALHYHSEASSSGTSSSDQKRLLPCKLCDSMEHRLRHCADFKELSYAERLELITREKLCSVCLNEHGGQCKFKSRCNVGDCKEYHNPLMHPVDNAGAVGMSAHIRSNCMVMFRMLPVQLYCGDKSIKVLAFLDEGSSVTLLEQNLADRLGIVGVKERLTIKWTADVTREEEESRRMNLWASGVSADTNNKLLLNSVRTVDKLMLPRQRLDCQELAAQYEHVRGLRIQPYDGQPQLLIGLNNIHSFAPMDTKVGAPVEPIAVRFKLGWTVYGPRHSTTVSASNYLGYHHTEHDRHEQLENNHAPEKPVVVVPQHVAEEKRTQKTHERVLETTGDRFETGLQWQKEDHRFPVCISTEDKKMKRLTKNSEQHEIVCKQMDDNDSSVGTMNDCVELLPSFNIHDKIDIQGLKRSNCDWDQDNDVRCWKLWRRWTSLMPEVEGIGIPCSYLDNAEHAEIDAYVQVIFNGLPLRSNKSTFEETDGEPWGRGAVVFTEALETVKLSAVQAPLGQDELQHPRIFLWQRHSGLSGVRNLVNPELPEIPDVTGWVVATPQKQIWHHCISA